MKPTIITIKDVLARYVAKHPEEAGQLARLSAQIDAGTNLTSRLEFGGHVTCGALLVNERAEVLMINHRIHGRWLLPGGHIEPGDSSLIDVAIRELHEEVGITRSQLAASDDGLPLDIEIHAIAPNLVLNEPAHWHADFVYLFRFTGGQVTPCSAREVADLRWSTLAEAPIGKRQAKAWRRLNGERIEVGVPA